MQIELPVIPFNGVKAEIAVSQGINNFLHILGTDIINGKFKNYDTLEVNFITWLKYMFQKYILRKLQFDIHVDNHRMLVTWNNYIINVPYFPKLKNK